MAARSGTADARPEGVRRVRSEWTPKQVADALLGYSQMADDASAGYLRGALDTENGRATIYVAGAPIEMLAARRCDIELAVKHLHTCHAEQAKAVILYYLRGWFDYRHCAARIGTSRMTAFRLVQRGARRIACFLCGYEEAGEEIGEFL
jgi:hypothetical protein